MHVVIGDQEIVLGPATAASSTSVPRRIENRSKETDPDQRDHAALVLTRTSR
jgi:hypothetical protein